MKFWILCFGLFLSNFLFAQTETNPVKKIIIGNDGKKAVLANGDTVVYKGDIPKQEEGILDRKLNYNSGQYLIKSSNFFMASYLTALAGGGLALAGSLTQKNELTYVGAALGGVSLFTALGGILNLKYAGIQLKKEKAVANIYIAPTGFSAKLTF